MKHIKSLDALRAFSVLAVVAAHAQYLPCGWIGVQVFFVLSGFLITGILQRHKDNSLKAYLGRFYWRRTVRVWPLYGLYIGLLAAAFLVARKPEEFAQQWPFLLTYTSNFYLPTEFKGLGFFDHLWSLSVEEQFYLVWPFVVFFAPLPLFRRLLVALLVAGPFVRYGTAALLWPVFSNANVMKAVYNSPFSHVDAFAAGALVAVLPAHWLQRLQAHSGKLVLSLFALVALSGIAMLVTTGAHGINEWLSLGYRIHMPRHLEYVWGYTLLNLCSAVLIFHLVSHDNPPRAFKSRALIYIGKISYGVYVWHLLVLQLFLRLFPAWGEHRLSPRGLATLAVYVVTVLLVASASYFGFEQFFLRLKDRVAPERRPDFRPADA